MLIALFNNQQAKAENSYSDSLIQVTEHGKRIINQFGLYYHYNFLFHNSAFQSLPGIPNCCSEFDGGSGSGYELGGIMNFRFNEMFGFNLRAGYRSGQALLVAPQFLDIGVNGVKYPGKIEHSISIRETSIDFTGLLSAKVYDNFLLYLGANFDLHNSNKFEQKETLIKPDIGTFENGSRTRNQKSGDLPSAEKNGYALITGLGYNFVISRDSTMMLSPEIFWRYSFTPLIKEYDWYENILSIGLAFKYNLKERQPDTTYPSFLKFRVTTIDTNHREQEPINIMRESYYSNNKLIKSTLNPIEFRFYPQFITHNQVKNWKITIARKDSAIRSFEAEGFPPEVIDWDLRDDSSKVFARQEPFRIGLSLKDSREDLYNSETTTIGMESKRNDINTNVSAEFIDEHDQVHPADTVVVDQTISTNLRPLLSYIFFEKNSAMIPERYERLKADETETFRIENLRGLSELPTYYKVLNIFGRRLRDNPNTDILLTGCNSDQGIEEGNVALSRMRAESVKRYFVKVWGIDDKRIAVKARNAPKNESKTSEREFYDAVRDENRRVEISSDYDEIMRPVVTFDTLKILTPKAVRFTPSVQSNKKIENWHYALYIGNTKIADSSSVDDKTHDHSISVRENEYRFLPENKQITYYLDAKTIDGISADSKISVPVKLYTRDSTLDKYSLILFDFNSHKISDDNSKIAAYINSRIVKDAMNKIAGTVEIAGYTDNVGAESYNLNLSTERANALNEFMNLPKEHVSVRGLGESQLLYPVDSPEGRLYCRTVTIIVRNPRVTK